MHQVHPIIVFLSVLVATYYFLKYRDAREQLQLQDEVIDEYFDIIVALAMEQENQQQAKSTKEDNNYGQENQSKTTPQDCGTTATDAGAGI